MAKVKEKDGVTMLSSMRSKMLTAVILSLFITNSVSDDKIVIKDKYGNETYIISDGKIRDKYGFIKAYVEDGWVTDLYGNKVYKLEFNDD